MDLDLLSNIFYAMVRTGTPLLLVALGELICEKSGVLNLGQEGMMLFGAVIGFIVALSTGNLWLGVLLAMSAGMLLSMLFVAAVIVGGSGNRWGAIVGGALVAYLPERFREFADYRLLVFGLALTVLAVLKPDGLLPPRRTRRAKLAESEIDALEEGQLDG